jgi:hypothetical protein
MKDNAVQWMDHYNSFHNIQCVQDLTRIQDKSNMTLDDKEHLLFTCKSTKDIRLRFAGLPMSSLRFDEV